MRLRHQFLLLVALLLLGVLGGSFAWLFSDLRAEFRQRLERSLETSVAAFRAGEDQRFLTLETIATSLEGSPGFRNVLRGTDYATLADFLADLNQRSRVDLAVITDAEGRTLARTDRQGLQGEDFSTETIVAQALEDYSLGYWLLAGKLYQCSAVPLLDGQGYVNGALILGYRVDADFARRMAAETGGEVAFVLGDSFRLSTESTIFEDGAAYLRRQVKLGGLPLERGHLLMARDLSPIEAFVVRSRLKLVSLGGIALLVALALSIPLIGKITNPVEELEKAQAEMEALFSSNLDGLLAIDQGGAVAAANPAAGVALGQEVSQLQGRSLAELLPTEVHSQLTADSGALVQRATLRRQGRTFELLRTFVRSARAEDLGSILLTHDVTEEREREERLHHFLDALTHDLIGPDSPLPVRIALTNLVCFSELREPDFSLDLQPLPVSELVSRVVEESSIEVEVVSGADLGWVEAHSQYFSHLLHCLLDNAHRHGSGRVKLSLERDGGSIRITVEDEGEGPDPAVARGLFQLELARDTRGAGLSLPICAALAVAHEGRLEYSGGSRFLLRLPVSIHAE